MTVARIAERFARAAKRRGGPVTLRLTYKSTSPPYGANPPTLTEPVVDATASFPGCLTIRANSAGGRLIPGDMLLIGGVRYSVTAEVHSRSSSAPPGFDRVPVTPPPPALADGTPIALTYVNDYTVVAPVSAFPRGLVDGDLIKTEDLQVLLPAVGSNASGQMNLPRAPDVGDIIFFDGDSLTVVSVRPRITLGKTIAYDVQAR